MLRILFLLATLLPGVALADCCKVVEPAALGGLDTIVPRLADKRVVFVGESHDQYGHHLAQLAVIRALHARTPDLAIGLEQFQQPFQEPLDAYVAGEIDEGEMLQRTEYFGRWRFDYRLYRPILRFAREKGIPLVALNVPSELTRRVGKVGFDGLEEELRAQLPGDMGEADEAYRGRLRRVFHMHPDAAERNFEHFVQAQLLWDEGMAARAADYLDEHPGRRMVVLAGSGHVAHAGAIPTRLARRGVGPAAVLACDLSPGGNEVADFILYPERQQLPPKGMLGVFLEEREQGVYAASFSEGSAGQAAGMREGDRIAAIAGGEVRHMGELKMRMFEREPGDRVVVEVERGRFLVGPERLSIEVELR